MAEWFFGQNITFAIFSVELQRKTRFEHRYTQKSEKNVNKLMRNLRHRFDGNIGGVQEFNIFSLLHYYYYYYYWSIKAEQN